MTKNLKHGPRTAMRELITQIPNEGCLIMFHVNRKSVQSRVSEMGLTSMLEVHKLSPGHRRRDNANVPCDVYICWRE